MQRIHFEDLPGGWLGDMCPPDGTYAVISYGGAKVTVRGFRVSNPFPWIATIYVFKEGAGREISCGSNPGDMIIDYDVRKVFLDGIDATMRLGLEEKLKRRQIVLVSENAH